MRSTAGRPAIDLTAGDTTRPPRQNRGGLGGTTYLSELRRLRRRGLLGRSRRWDGRRRLGRRGRRGHLGAGADGGGLGGRDRLADGVVGLGHRGGFAGRRRADAVELRNLAVLQLRSLPVAFGLLRDTGDLTDRAAQTLERVADLARHDPQLVRVALGDRRQHLQVLVRQQTLVRLAGVDRVEDRGDGLRLTLRLQDPRFPLGLRPQDPGLLVTFGGEDRGLLLALGGQHGRLPHTFRGEDRGALVTVGAHLLLHRVLDRRRRVDRAQLDPVDPDPPLAGRLVQHVPELLVDLLTRGQRLLQVHATDDVAQRGHGELLDGLDVVRDLVRRPDRVVHLEVDDGVDRYHQVVLGDHALRRERDDLLAHVDGVADLVDERGQQVQAGLQPGLELPEPLDDPDGLLLHHPDGLDECDDHQQGDQCQHYEERGHLTLHSKQNPQDGQSFLSTVHPAFRFPARRLPDRAGTPATAAAVLTSTVLRNRGHSTAGPGVSSAAGRWGSGSGSWGCSAGGAAGRSRGRRRRSGRRSPSPRPASRGRSSTPRRTGGLSTAHRSAGPSHRRPGGSP